MQPRFAHLVGSLPGEDPEQAMGTALELLGERLRSLPDGETGERRNWVISIVDALRDHPDLEVATPGEWTSYDDTPKLRVRPGHKLYGANLDFGHVDAVRERLPVFERLRAEHGRHDLAFQSGVPGDFDLAMFTFGPVGAVRERRAFTEATLTEIHRVADLAGPGTVFQIEVPVELVLLAKAPPVLLPLAADLMARSIVGVAAAARPGLLFGVHLCLGDMNHQAFGTMNDVAPLVALANAIVRHWPERQVLSYVHAPFAAADQPPSTTPAFYAPLANLTLPETTRFANGA